MFQTRNLITGTCDSIDTACAPAGVKTISHVTRGSMAFYFDKRTEFSLLSFVQYINVDTRFCNITKKYPISE